MPESPLPAGCFLVETTSGQELPAQFANRRVVVDDSKWGTEQSASKCACCSARETNRRTGAKDRPPAERKVCWNGDKCPFLRLGTCFFLHPNGPPPSEELPPRYSRSVKRRRLRRRAAARGSGAGLFGRCEKERRQLEDQEAAPPAPPCCGSAEGRLDNGRHRHPPQRSSLGPLQPTLCPPLWGPLGRPLKLAQ